MNDAYFDFAIKARYAIRYEDELFGDMTLQNGLSTVLDILDEWGCYLHPSIERARFEPLEGNGSILGQYNPETKVIRLIENFDESTLLHEMIHFYENELEALNPALCELVLVELWAKLAEQIDDLESRVFDFLEVVGHNLLENDGGKHGLLFLLKSYDLDLRCSYELGTVMGYGMAN